MVDLQPSARREKYGRLLSSITVDGMDYAQHMIAKGYGVYYDGGRKVDWCAGAR